MSPQRDCPFCQDCGQQMDCPLVELMFHPTAEENAAAERFFAQPAPVIPNEVLADVVKELTGKPVMFGADAVGTITETKLVDGCILATVKLEPALRAITFDIDLSK